MEDKLLSSLRNFQQRRDFDTKRWNTQTQAADLDFWTLNNENKHFNVSHFRGKVPLIGSYFFDFGSVESTEWDLPFITTPTEETLTINCSFYPILEDFDRNVFSELVLGTLIETKNIYEIYYNADANVSQLLQLFRPILSFAYELNFPDIVKCYGIKGQVDFADITHSPIFASQPFFRHMRNVQ